MTFQEKLEEYAKIIVSLGIHVTKGKYVLLSCPIIAADFGRLVAKNCYKAGAKDVIMFYHDEKFSRLRYDCAAKEVIADIPFWQAERRNYYAREGCCNISIIADDPEIFTGAESDKLMSAAIASKKAYKEFYDILDRGGVRWTVVAYPNPKWAKKIFPDLSEDDAVNALMEQIFQTVRIGSGDSQDNWKKHDAILKERAKKLNDYSFTSLHYRNHLGTDLSVFLPDGHIWYGGSEQDRDGVDYFPNMPTEEIFTMPHKDKTEGIVYSAMPLVYQGAIIDAFYLKFHNGKVVDYDAKKGKEVLTRLLDTDDGSKMLGEVALIPYDSPIRKTGLLFYETLFDENASCHLALGECYPNTIRNGENMTEEELANHGGNKSVNHVDFMIGTADLSIDGILSDGSVIPVFRDGNFVF